MEPSIRSAALAGFQDLVFELGGDPSRIFSEMGLPDDILLKPDTRISLADYRTAMNLAASQTGVASFGLLLSQRQQFEAHGVIGYLTKHSATLGAAITSWITYLKTHQPHTQTRLVPDGDTVFWELRLAFTANVPDHHHSETSAGLVVKFIRQNMDPSWNPDAVHFGHKAPADRKLHARIFRCPVFFQAERECIEFPASDLDRPLRYADPILHTLLQSYEQGRSAPAAPTLKDRVQHRISDAMDEAHIGMDAVSADLGLTRAQLQARLKAEGWTYREILDAVRIERARKLLADTEASLTEITASLGYAQSAVFTRAFKRLVGTTPSAWRRLHRQAPAPSLTD